MWSITIDNYHTTHPDRQQQTIHNNQQNSV